MFDSRVALAALVAGAVGSVVAFGIGSMLTPLVGVRFGVRAAVVIVSVPHFAATVLRAFRLRREIDRVVLLRSGIGLLVFAGLMGVTGLAKRMRFGRKTACGRARPSSRPGRSLSRRRLALGVVMLVRR